jgi:hypothetical protein
MDAEVRLNVMRIIRIGLWVMIVLVMASLLVPLIEFENPAVELAASKLLLDSERNPGAFFSFLLLLLAGLLLAVIAAKERHLGGRWWRHWAALAAIFVLLAYDEAAMLHEQLTEPLGASLKTGGLFLWAWVIPGLIFVGVIFAVYLPFLLALPPMFRNLFLLSGALFVGGALGLEMLSGLYYEGHGRTQTYTLITTIEEVLEMAGALLFIYSLTRYLTVRGDRFEIRLTLLDEAPASTTAGAAEQFGPPPMVGQKSTSPKSRSAFN